MDSTVWALIVSAISISFIHTASGPDHYLPFIVLSKSRKWSKVKTILLTVLCGLGHVASSLLLGLTGVALGWQLHKISWFQNLRGNFSGWALLLLGLVYLIYGLIKALRNKPHKHFDVMNDEVYVYKHRHNEMVATQKRIKITPLVLFMIFVMGPSEPLIPLLFYSGIKHSLYEIILLVSSFTITTVLTMVVMVLLGRYGYSSLIGSEKLERYMIAVSGMVVTVCGIGMVFLGW